MKTPLSPSRPTDEDSAAKLHKIYDEMRSRQRKAIQKAGALRSDPYFVPDGLISANPDATPSDALSGPDMSTDDRRCLAISSIVDESTEAHWTPAFLELQRRLQDEFAPYGLTFSQTPPKVGGGQLHWTLMQLVGFPDYDAEVLQEDTVYLSPEYLDCVQDSLTVGGLDTGIHITYVGVILVATGLLMIGVPSLDINEARDIVRSRLELNKLPLKEPFVKDIVHSTLYRVAGDASNMPKDLHRHLMDTKLRKRKSRHGCSSQVSDWPRIVAGSLSRNGGQSSCSALGTDSRNTGRGIQRQYHGRTWVHGFGSVWSKSSKRIASSVGPTDLGGQRS